MHENTPDISHITLFRALWQIADERLAGHWMGPST